MVANMRSYPIKDIYKYFSMQHKEKIRNEVNGDFYIIV